MCIHIEPCDPECVTPNIEPCDPIVSNMQQHRKDNQDSGMPTGYADRVCHYYFC